MAERTLRPNRARNYRALHEGKLSVNSSSSESSVDMCPSSPCNDVLEFFNNTNIDNVAGPKSKATSSLTVDEDVDSLEDHTPLSDLLRKEVSLELKLKQAEASSRISRLESRLRDLDNCRSSSSKTAAVPRRKTSSSSAIKSSSRYHKHSANSTSVLPAAHSPIIEKSSIATQASKVLHSLTRKVDILSSSSCTDATNSTSSGSDSSSDESLQLRKHRGNPKSGRVAKAHEIVIKTLPWPHTYLKYSHVNNNVKFDSLDLPLLVAGELEIAKCSSATSKEKSGRADLLQSVMYSSKLFTWSNCIEFFGAVLAFIERGGDWSDTLSIQSIQQNTLLVRKSSRSPSSGTGTPSTTGGAGDSQPRTWFCRPFQSGECSLPDGHEQPYRGTSITVHHICAHCYTVRKVQLKHSEANCHLVGSSSTHSSSTDHYTDA